MKIVRYLDSQGAVRLGSLGPDGRALEVEGDLFGAFKVTSKPADLRELLAPVAPTHCPVPSGRPPCGRPARW